MPISELMCIQPLPFHCENFIIHRHPSITYVCYRWRR